MRMAVIFTAFAAVAGALGLLMPHIVHRLGFRMMIVYLVFASLAAVLGALRPSKR